MKFWKSVFFFGTILCKESWIDLKVRGKLPKGSNRVIILSPYIVKYTLLRINFMDRHTTQWLANSTLSKTKNQNISNNKQEKKNVKITYSCVFRNWFKTVFFEFVIERCVISIFTITSWVNKKWWRCEIIKKMRLKPL